MKSVRHSVLFRRSLIALAAMAAAPALVQAHVHFYTYDTSGNAPGGQLMFMPSSATGSFGGAGNLYSDPNNTFGYNATPDPLYPSEINVTYPTITTQEGYEGVVSDPSNPTTLYSLDQAAQVAIQLVGIKTISGGNPTGTVNFTWEITRDDGTDSSDADTNNPYDQYVNAAIVDGNTNNGGGTLVNIVGTHGNPTTVDGDDAAGTSVLDPAVNSGFMDLSPLVYTDDTDTTADPAGVHWHGQHWVFDTAGVYDLEFQAIDLTGALAASPIYTIQIDATPPIPEPASLGLLAVGSVGLFARRRRR